MRKRSKYRPKGVFINPVAYVLESLTPVSQYRDTFLLDLKIKNHAAMTLLVRGVATKRDIDVLIAAANIVEALYRLGFGAEYKDVMAEGQDALLTVGKRGASNGKFILRADEMSALNALMELHDAQMEVITVKDMERALQIVDREYRAKKMRPIVEKQT